MDNASPINNEHLSCHKSRQVFFVCPCFNEEETIDRFWEQLNLVAQSLREYGERKVVFVDDGSGDGTYSRLLNLRSAAGVKVFVVKLTKNFGHQAAVYAGLQFVQRNLSCQQNDTVVVLDSDGQHPPAFIHDLLREREAGFHHVQMLRDDAAGISLQRVFSRLFYRLFRLASGMQLREGAADFRAFSGYVLSCFFDFNESPILNRAVFEWLGFRTKHLSYKPGDRLAGKTKYSFFSRLQLAVAGLIYFSAKPLLLTLFTITFFGFFACFIYLFSELIRILHGAPFVPGWPTLIFTVCFWGAITALGQFVTGLYLASIFDESKRRPKYIIETTVQTSE